MITFGMIKFSKIIVDRLKFLRYTLLKLNNYKSYDGDG